MIILGINAYHGDAAAAIIRDGELIAAGKAGQEALMNWETVKTQLSRCKISNITVTSGVYQAIR